MPYLVLSKSRNTDDENNGFDDSYSNSNNEDYDLIEVKDKDNKDVYTSTSVLNPVPNDNKDSLNEPDFGNTIDKNEFYDHDKAPALNKVLNDRIK